MDRVTAKLVISFDFGGEERTEAFGLRLHIKAGLFNVDNHVYVRFSSILAVDVPAREPVLTLVRQALALSATSKHPTMGVWKAG